jgi:DNA-binding phage protein
MCETKTIDEGSIEAAENLVIDFQFALQDALTEGDVSRGELANRSGYSKRRISKRMSAEGEPRLRDVAAIFHALGKQVKLQIVDIK